jgi:hypothetical protein
MRHTPDWGPVSVPWLLSDKLKRLENRNAESKANINICDSGYQQRGQVKITKLRLRRILLI